MTAMNHSGDHNITCDQLDELLPDHLEGTLPATQRAAIEAHAAGCGRCASLIDDLNGITAAAAALPTLRPPRDLWDGISARIEAPVIRLDAESARREAMRGGAWPHRGLRRSWLGAAAAALVAVTAGVTHQLTVRNMERGGAAAVAAADPASSTGAAGRPAASGPGETLPVAAPTESTPAAHAPVRLADAAPRSAAPAGGQPRGVAITAVAERRAAVRAAYDREITSLREILSERRAALSPSTVEVLELNLRIIDQAIEQSRAALARDPASVFLDQRLNHALEKKIELLRTAALLPAT
jgi:hypothetical protein